MSPSSSGASSALDALTNPERLRALQRYRVIGTPQEHLDRIPRLAARIYDTPIALLTLLGDERQRFIAAVGTDLDGVAARPSVCRYTIASEAPMIVENLADDERFADEDYVTGMHLRFYAGASLTTSDGHRIGTVCVYDVRPRSVNPDRLGELQDLADMAMEALERDQFSLDDRPELTQTVLDHLPGIFYVVGKDGALKRWNSQFEVLSGYSADDLDDHPAAGFFTGEDRTQVEAAIREVFETGSATVEAGFVTRTGDQIPMILTGVRARIRGEHRLVGMGIDISERKRREQQLQAAKDAAEAARQEAEAARADAEQERRRAEQASASKSRFLAGVAHDLKSPVSAIEGFANILADRLEGEPAELAGSIRRGVQQIDDMANSLMELARLGSGRLDLEVESIEVTALLHDVADDLAAKADTHAIDLAVLADAPVWAIANPSSLRRALTNLVDNALTYSHSGDTVTLRAHPPDETETTETGSPETVVIVVEDTGPGIDPEFLDRLFEPFARNAPDVDGTGLGLAVTKELVEAMDGRIRVDSTVGEGIRFEIALAAGEAA